MATRFPACFAAFLCFLLFSCSNSSRTDKELIKAMEESLINSNKVISFSTRNIMHRIEEKKQEPQTSFRASIWFSKAEEVVGLSLECYNYIEELKKEPKLSEDAVKKIILKLKQYEYKILNTDSLICQTFSTSPYHTYLIDTTSTSEKKIYANILKNVSKESSIAYLSKLQNNLKILENKTLAFCLEQIPSPCGWYDFFSAIVGQSSEVVEPGKEINITAGVGAFSKTANPKITINGKEVPLNDSGFSRYKLNTPEKQGIYQIPVRISYTDQDGKEQYIETRVKYTVAKICE